MLGTNARRPSDKGLALRARELVVSIHRETEKGSLLGNLKDKSVRKGPVLLGTGPFLF